MTTNDLGHATAPIALDTCILIRNTARRMLAGVQEACSSWILLPQETVRECNVPYAAVAGKRIKRRLEREALARWGRDWSDPQVRWLRTEGRRLTSREARGFKRWVHAEVLRNDSAYTFGPKKTVADVERAEQIAVEALEGEPGEQWDKGDPLVIAQAARAGAELVGTDNMRRVRQAKLDTLIAEWKAEPNGRPRDSAPTHASPSSARPTKPLPRGCTTSGNTSSTDAVPGLPTASAAPARWQADSPNRC